VLGDRKDISPAGKPSASFDKDSLLVNCSKIQNSRHAEQKPKVLVVLGSIYRAKTHILFIKTCGEKC